MNVATKLFCFLFLAHYFLRSHFPLSLFQTMYFCPIFLNTHTRTHLLTLSFTVSLSLPGTHTHYLTLSFTLCPFFNAHAISYTLFHIPLSFYTHTRAHTHTHTITISLSHSVYVSGCVNCQIILNCFRGKNCFVFHSSPSMLCQNTTLTTLQLNPQIISVWKVSIIWMKMYLGWCN